MTKLNVGDVVELKAGKFILVSRSTLRQLSMPIQCVVEGIRDFQPGSEDDHFESGSVVDVRELIDGKYDGQQPMLTIAIDGDYNDKYLFGDLTPIRKLKKNYT